MGNTSRLILLPCAATAALVGAPAQATTYLSVADAQAQWFGSEILTPFEIHLDSATLQSIEQQTGTHVVAGALRGLRARDGFFYIDEVVGKHDLITYAVALTGDGRVRGVEILDYREAYGSEVRSAGWRRQFNGHRAGDALRVGREIALISGATLSCQHLTDGIRRLLAIHAAMVKGS